MGKLQSAPSWQSCVVVGDVKIIMIVVVMMMMIICSNVQLVIGKQYIIPNIPYFYQKTEYSCGPTSLEMVLSYYDGNFHREMKEDSFRIIQQEAIVDVARTSNHTGTNTLDIIRSARFSPISSTPTSQYYLQFPKQAPENGWFGVENSQNLLNKSMDSIYYFGGLMTMYYPDRDSHLVSVKCSEKKGGDGNVKCWVQELIDSFLKYDIPVICLMYYELPDIEGHYRVAVGYETELDKNGNEIPTRIIMWDPYNREGNPPISNFTISQFCNMWNYTEFILGNNCYKPYFGAAIYPLEIKANIKEGNLLVQYGHPQHLVSSEFVSKQVVKTLTIDNVVAKIRIYQTNSNDDELLKLVDSVDLQIAPRLNFGQNLSFSWKIPSIYALEKNIRIKIGIYGLVCDKTLTWRYENNSNKFSQGYKYCDQIGGTIFINNE